MFKTITYLEVGYLLRCINEQTEIIGTQNSYMPWRKGDVNPQVDVYLQMRTR